MKKIPLLLFVFLATASAFAQGDGMQGITDATGMVTSYFEPAVKLIYAIALWWA